MSLLEVFLIRNRAIPPFLVVSFMNPTKTCAWVVFVFTRYFSTEGASPKVESTWPVAGATGWEATIPTGAKTVWEDCWSEWFLGVGRCPYFIVTTWTYYIYIYIASLSSINKSICITWYTCGIILATCQKTSDVSLKHFTKTNTLSCWDHGSITSSWARRPSPKYKVKRLPGDNPWMQSIYAYAPVMAMSPREWISLNPSCINWRRSGVSAEVLEKTPRGALWKSDEVHVWSVWPVWHQKVS